MDKKYNEEMLMDMMENNFIELSAEDQGEINGGISPLLHPVAAAYMINTTGVVKKIIDIFKK